MSVGKCCTLYQTSSIWDRIIKSNADDADIQRKITNMFIRTNILIRKFSKCPITVKVYCVLKHTAYVYMMLPCGKGIIFIILVHYTRQNAVMLVTLQ